MKHYYDNMENRQAQMLKCAIKMALVIMAFRTTFSMKGGCKMINNYYRNMPAKVRRHLHVAVIRYMEQDCICPNHVQCDIVPLNLTSGVVLPSYQQYLEREHHNKHAKLDESETLDQYGKTILMLILARVNGYYSPYSAQSITEQEERCFFGNVFTHAEKEFLKHRLQSKFHKITKESIETALTFLEKQKIANCPCKVHTESRGYSWVVFRRQPVRLPTLYYDVEQTDSEDGDNEDDYFSEEPVDNDKGEEDQTNSEMNPDITGAASVTDEFPTDGLKEKPEESGPGDASSIHSRDADQHSQMEKTPEREEENMDSEDPEDPDDNQSVMCAMLIRRPNYVCFKTLMYYSKQLDRNYYYRYFKPYIFDHRLLAMGHDCGCLMRRPHKTSCSWYDTDNIYMIESRADLSISEKSAQQKIYKIYMETLNNLPDECGCGTLASISYMGHSTSCNEFKHLHERESHEVLLAILNKKKKLSFDDETEFNPTQVNFDVPADINADQADTTQVVTIPCAKETTSELNNSSPQALSMFAKNVTSTKICQTPIQIPVLLQTLL